MPPLSLAKCILFDSFLNEINLVQNNEFVNENLL